MNAVSLVLVTLIGLSIGYLYLLAIASLRVPHIEASKRPAHSFAVVIPAHNEEATIAETIRRLLVLDYPRKLFQVFVVADHCSDGTAKEAQSAGSVCLQRDDGVRSGKGAALAWLFKHIIAQDSCYDAVVVFDADTRVDASFLRIMDARLQRGDLAIQGCHRILNPQDGWFPALTWAMFIVDNRFQNLGRANLGWSAKNMGDSICFRAEVLKRLGWGEGLTDDYEFRQRLLLQGIKIGYEPAAIGYGEAPASWSAARAQRARWLSGTFRASRNHAWAMLREGLRRNDSALLDGAVQSFLPSYSTLTLISGLFLAVHLFMLPYVASQLILGWSAMVIGLAIYPLLGLAMERAPVRAYLAILSGPVFILWRTVIGILARSGKPVEWVRTARRGAAHVGVGK